MFKVCQYNLNLINQLKSYKSHLENSGVDKENLEAPGLRPKTSDSVRNTESFRDGGWGTGTLQNISLCKMISFVTLPLLPLFFY